MFLFCAWLFFGEESARAVIDEVDQCDAVFYTRCEVTVCVGGFEMGLLLFYNSWSLGGLRNCVVLRRNYAPSEFFELRIFGKEFQVVKCLIPRGTIRVDCVIKITE